MERHRGRKSSAELSVVSLDRAKIDPPPPGLSPEAAAEWVAILRVMPSGWLGREMRPLLTAFCRHVAEAEGISAQVAVLDRALGAEVDKGRPAVAVICESAIMRERLLKMRDRETRAASSLATRMRLTPQSRIDKTKALTRSLEHPPWEGAVLVTNPRRPER